MTLLSLPLAVHPSIDIYISTKTNVSRPRNIISLLPGIPLVHQHDYVGCKHKLLHTTRLTPSRPRDAYAPRAWQGANERVPTAKEMRLGREGWPSATPYAFPCCHPLTIDFFDYRFRNHSIHFLSASSRSSLPLTILLPPLSRRFPGPTAWTTPCLC